MEEHFGQNSGSLQRMHWKQFSKLYVFGVVLINICRQSSPDKLEILERLVVLYSHHCLAVLCAVRIVGLNLWLGFWMLCQVVIYEDVKVEIEPF